MKDLRGCILKSSFLLIIALVIGLPLNCCAAKGKIRFADCGWDSSQVHNRIAGFIIEHGMGYEPEYIPGDTIVLCTALQRGDIDVLMESWTENIQEVYDKGIKDNTMIDLGSNFPDNWQGWLVPTYMIKGDPERGIKPKAPDLKTVHDLAKYWKVFRDPENPAKGRFYNSIPGWGCTKVNSQKLKTYGLDKFYSDFITGSDAALNGSLAAAYKRGKPWVGYYWEPTWILGKYDMTRLAEPPFNQEIWDSTKGCEYPPVQVNILVNAKMPEKAPDIVEFLRNYETTTAQANKFLAYMQNTKGSSQDAAVWFLKNYEAVWTPWVSAGIVKKVQAALK